jgi:AcrR family transcriptional regulator
VKLAHATASQSPIDPAVRRRVGRPRHHSDEVERELIVEAGYAALRQHQGEMTLAHVLDAAHVSSRSFYRHFDSKDALLCALYRRDAEYAGRRVDARLQRAADPAAAVEAWIDEIYSFTRSPRRAERVAVLGSIPALHADGIEAEVAYARTLLVNPLQRAIEEGVAAGVFAPAKSSAVADLLAVAVLHGSGVQSLSAAQRVDQRDTTALCRRALGIDPDRR